VFLLKRDKIVPKTLGKFLEKNFTVKDINTSS